MSEQNIRSRLRIFQYNKRACEAAIRGEEIPYALGLPLTRLCVVCGIRYHPGFGEELRGIHPLFTRALNARSIMSGEIPVLDNENDFPYCIWYPDIAPEDTYRKLVQQYPTMKYQVARACAVGGYSSLYNELDVLPEVHVAEEARESGNMAIYEAIMSKPVRYAAMDDYARTVSPTPRPGACLNGDTAICASLAKKQAFSYADDMDDVLDEWEEPFYFVESRGYEINTFNITEDMNIDDHRVNTPYTTPSPLVLELLSSPLPFDLPTLHKNLLILMSAYYGDVDRYDHLRRIEPIAQEIDCCVRGIYHNTMFAIWWDRQQKHSGKTLPVSFRIDAAVSARMIMNNVLHRMKAPSSQHGDPYMIWYPSIAAETTYQELFRLRPSMATQVLRACIAGNYPRLFKDVLFQTEPDLAVVADANAAGGFFEEHVEQRVAGLDGKVTPLPFHEPWKGRPLKELQKVSNSLSKTMGRTISSHFDGLYEGFQCNAEGIEMFASMPKHWRGFPLEPLLRIDYKDWPPRN